MASLNRPLVLFLVGRGTEGPFPKCAEKPPVVGRAGYQQPDPSRHSLAAAYLLVSFT